jgi:hypothetical protein
VTTLKISFLFAAVFLFSCGNVSFDKEILLGERGSFTLLDPAYIEEALDTEQRITARYGDTEFTAGAWVQADAKGISMLFFNNFGASLGEFEYHSGAAAISSPYLPKNIKAEYFAADFQLCYYRVEELQKALAGLTIKSDAGEIPGTSIRRIYEDGALIIEIIKTYTDVTYTNKLRGYSYTIVNTPAQNQAVEN